MPSSIADVLFAKDISTSKKEIGEKISRTEEKNSFSNIFSKALITEKEGKREAITRNPYQNTRQTPKPEASADEVSSDQEKGICESDISEKEKQIEKVKEKTSQPNQSNGTEKGDKVVTHGDETVVEVELEKEQTELLQNSSLTKETELNIAALLLEEPVASTEYVSVKEASDTTGKTADGIFVLDNKGVVEETNSGRATARTPVLDIGEKSSKSSLMPEVEDPTPKIAENKIAHSQEAVKVKQEISQNTDNVEEKKQSIDANKEVVQLNFAKEAGTAKGTSALQKPVEQQVNLANDAAVRGSVGKEGMIEQNEESASKNEAAIKELRQETILTESGLVKGGNKNGGFGNNLMGGEGKDASRKLDILAKHEKNLQEDVNNNREVSSQKEVHLNRDVSSVSQNKDIVEVKTALVKEKDVEDLSTNLLKHNDNIIHHSKSAHQFADRGGLMSRMTGSTQTAFNDIVGHTLSKVEHFQSVLENIDRYVLSMVKEPSAKAITVTLIPEYLGKVVLSCKEEGTKLVVEIQAENNFVREMLQKEEGAIKAMLEQNGFKLSQFDVHTRSEQQAKNNERNFEGREELYDGAKERRKEASTHNAHPTKMGTAASGRKNGFWWVA